MSDPYEYEMHARAGLNEPAPEEPENQAEQLVEQASERVRRNSWAGTKMVIDALSENFKGTK